MSLSNDFQNTLSKTVNLYQPEINNPINFDTNIKNNDYLALG